MTVGVVLGSLGGLDLGWRGVRRGGRKGLFTAFVDASMRRRLAAGVDMFWRKVDYWRFWMRGVMEMDFYETAALRVVRGGRRDELLMTSQIVFRQFAHVSKKANFVIHSFRDIFQ